MTTLGWSVPSHRVDAETARRSILAQHAEIRELMRRAGSVADASLDGEALAPGAVANAVGDLRTIIEVHLDFEEEVLLPILRLDELVLGPAGRAEQLLADHRSQRAMLAALHREARAFPNLPILAAKLAFMTAWLASDMQEEERVLLK
jgi:hypothetical protein